MDNEQISQQEAILLITLYEVIGGHDCVEYWATEIKSDVLESALSKDLICINKNNIVSITEKGCCFAIKALNSVFV